ncbi:MAG TPA: Hsp20/alpha crystallin family protein [Bacillota bacterium]|nr:Hsp20/alpha crystallin family protein [Bacillota bacterium]
MKLAKRGKEPSGPLAPVSRAWSPFWPLDRLQEDIDRLLEEPFGGWLTPSGAFTETWDPVLDVYEDKENVVVKAELPGIKKEEIKVYMTDGMLNLAGERKQETETKRAGVYRSERYFGRFHRAIALPMPVEPNKIQAHYQDGVLTITCPKTEEAKRKQVEIKVE